MTIPKVPGQFIQEWMTVANLTLYSLAGIDDTSRETLEYIKQEDAMGFEIAMNMTGKSFKELSARRNNITKSLWKTKIKTISAQTFINDEV